MRPALIPIDSQADPRQLARAQRLVQVKFMAIAPSPPRGGVHRFISRVIGCLAAARP
jgi:hypothetical protein